MDPPKIDLVPLDRPPPQGVCGHQTPVKKEINSVTFSNPLEEIIFNPNKRIRRFDDSNPKGLRITHPLDAKKPTWAR